MLTVQNDWIRYEMSEADMRTADLRAAHLGFGVRPVGAAIAAVPARRVAVRGGAACVQRGPVDRARPAPTSPVRHGARPAASARPPRLRLTRRGRFVLLVLPALLALSGGLIALSAPGVAEASSAMPSRTVVVGSGDSLWTIAERIAPHTDPLTTVAALQRANHLHGSSLAAGSVLVLPAR